MAADIEAATVQVRLKPAKMRKMKAQRMLHGRNMLPKVCSTEPRHWNATNNGRARFSPTLMTAPVCGSMPRKRADTSTIITRQAKKKPTMKGTPVISMLVE
jgi:hypothetical protein